jgi:predicted protein tyrosine phosphatase
MKLKICGRFEVPDFANQGYTHMISIGDSNDYFDGLRLPEIVEDNYLILKFTDTEDVAHRDAPSFERMENLRVWLHRQSSVEGLLVHCAGGISRSPAVALLSMCHFFPEEDPLVHMHQVARSAQCSYVWPNQRVIELGDQLLERNGQVVAAVDEWKREKDQDAVQFE